MPSEKQKIYMLCTSCKGTGVVYDSNGQEDVCPFCNGEKQIEWGYLHVPQPE